MTFDLHYPNEQKAEAFKLWVRRIYIVASTLSLSYKELWDLPEQEFLVLEQISDEIIKRKKEEQDRIKNNMRG